MVGATAGRKCPDYRECPDFRGEIITCLYYIGIKRSVQYTRGVLISGVKCITLGSNEVSIIQEVS